MPRLTLAERMCTRQVMTSDGIKNITVDCTSSYSQTSESFRNRYLYQALMETLLEKVEEEREEQQTKIQDEQTKIQDQQARLEDLKEQQEMKKEQQEDLMQDRRDRN